MREDMHKLSTINRLVVLAVTVVIILGVINVEIIKKEAIVTNGTTVLLRIAPRDPRSLLQGDYMALRYTIAATVADKAKAERMTDGMLVVELNESGEANFLAFYTGQPLTETQHLLKFRRRGDSVRLSSDAYFFEEGQWEMYQRARFGELKVGDDGVAVLVGLRNEEFERMGDALILSPPD